MQFLEKAHIQPGQKVLIYGASGTSGTIAVQYAKHRGAVVTGVCSAEKADLVRSLGADKTLDYTRKDSVSKLESYDVALDAVGKARTSELKEVCRAQMSDKRKFFSIDDQALIDQIVDAHKYVERGHKKGNVAITVN